MRSQLPKLPSYDPETIKQAHQWHRIALERQAQQDGNGAADAATYALICAASSDPRRERQEFDQLRLDCLALQGSWFRPVRRRTLA